MDIKFNVMLSLSPAQFITVFIEVIVEFNFEAITRAMLAMT
jgi:hypothetical protein